jgi:MYXO-CTERM domain-containing protein
VPDICWTVAQESAHAFGLDHEFLCPDPMTYLGGCGSEKWFRNQKASCGEDRARPCMCRDPSGQNSVEVIRGVFGAGSSTPPTVAISEPQDGDTVSKGFQVTVSASDDVEVGRVELWVNNQLIGSDDSPPYTFLVPSSLADGVQNVEARAYDIYDAQGVATIQVTQGVPCQSAAQCPEGDTCVDGRCVLGPGQAGGLGETCATNEECASRQCGRDGDTAFCAETCELGARGCPDGFGCREAGDHGVCWPGYDDGGGCSAGGHGRPLWIALALLALLAARRRR